MEQVTPCMAVAYLSWPVLGDQWKFVKEKHYGASIYVKEDGLTESDQTADTICYIYSVITKWITSYASIKFTSLQ